MTGLTGPPRGQSPAVVVEGAFAGDVGTLWEHVSEADPKGKFEGPKSTLHFNELQRRVAGGLGFEPRLAESESFAPL